MRIFIFLRGNIYFSYFPQHSNFIRFNTLIIIKKVKYICRLSNKIDKAKPIVRLQLIVDTKKTKSYLYGFTRIGI